MPITPRKNIFEAAWKNDERSVEYFVETKRVPVDSRNAVGQTAAHVAASRGNLVVLKYLLGKDPSLVTATDRWEQTALHLAAEKGALDMVEYLVDDRDADVSRYNNLLSRNNVLHIAAEAGHLEVVKYLIERKMMDPDERNSEGRPAAFLAANYDHVHIIEYLAEYTNANLTTIDDGDRNILFTSASSFNGSPRVPKYLLDRKNLLIDLNWKDSIGLTVTNFACRFPGRSIDLVKYFVDEKHADLDIGDYLGRTPLYHASHTSNVRLVEYLLKRGADPTVKDVFGKTALDVATDSTIIQSIKESAGKRVRRSWSKPFRSFSSAARQFGFVPLQESRSTTEGNVPAGADQRSTLSPLKYSGNNGLVRTATATDLSRVVDILALANVCAKFCNRAARSSWISSTPREVTLYSRMDPNALDVVNSDCFER